MYAYSELLAKAPWTRLVRIISVEGSAQQKDERSERGSYDLWVIFEGHGQAMRKNTEALGKSIIHVNDDVAGEVDVQASRTS